MQAVDMIVYMLVLGLSSGKGPFCGEWAMPEVLGNLLSFWDSLVSLGNPKDDPGPWAMCKKAWEICTQNAS
jgi:hypothetical protein